MRRRRGNYGFASVQDGEYWVRTPATATNKADSARIAIYHDEAMDDDADDGITGTPVIATASFDVTALRLEIKGYVVNDGHEGDHETPDLDRIVRGDEAVAGIELELLTITSIKNNKKDTTFKSHGTTETDDDGSYSFDDVVEGDSYYVRATSTGEYVAAEASAKDGFSVKVAADEYPAAGDPNMVEGEFDLPYWDYNAGTTMHTSVPVSNEAGTVKANFVNFALLYVDGSISGRVREASGNPGNITVELIRCETYDAGDAKCDTYDRDNFPTQTTETKSNGTWEFNDLLEGWYEVYVGEAGYLAADITAMDIIDDDGGIESPEMHTGLLKGRRDLASGNNFYVYDNGLDDDDDLDDIEVEGTTDPDEDPEDLARSAAIAAQGANMATAITGMRSTPITFGSESVTVEPDVHRDASFKVTTGSGTTLKSWPISSSGVATVDLDYNATGSATDGAGPRETVVMVSVTAQNGYDDHDYTFSASRMDPVGNFLTERDFTVEEPSTRVFASGGGVIDVFETGVAEDVNELTFTVDLEDIEKQVLLVSMDGDEVMPSDRKRADGAHEQRYEVALAAGANTIELTVTSEDNVARTYQLIVRRREDNTVGAPVIEGETEVGQTLTINTSGMSDPDGISSFVAYNWWSYYENGNFARTLDSDDADYTLTADDIGMLIRVNVRYEDSYGRVDNSNFSDFRGPVTDVPDTRSDDATLSSLTLNGGVVMLNEDWAATTYEYTANVENSVETAMVAATATDEGGATITLPDPNPVPLPVGPKTITVTVRAEADNTQDYTVTVTREDAPPTATPTVTLMLDPTSITENGGMSTLTATVAPASATAFDVTVSAAPAGAVTMSATTLSFAANATSATAGVTITALNNDVDAPDQTVTVSGATPSGVTAPVAVMLTITDDDDPPPSGQQVTLVLDVTRITEEEGVSTVTARVSPASPTAFTVEVSAAAVSPAVDGDFILSAANNNILTFAANATRSTGTVTITAVGNTVDAPDKSVTVSGSVETADATAESPAEVTLTITDDDDVPGLPRAFNVAAGDVEAVLTWVRPLSIGTAQITGYQHRSLPAGQTFRDSDPWTEVSEDLRTATVPNLENGEAYQFQLRAKNGVRKGVDEERFDGGSAVTGTGTPWPAVTLAVAPNPIDEDGGESAVTATVANSANRPFTVTVTAESTIPGAFMLEGSTLSFAANASAATGDVKVAAEDNVVDHEDNAVVTVSGTMSTGSAAPADVAVTITDDDTKPAAPTLTAAVGDTEVTLTWTFPDREGSSNVTGFEYRYSDEDLTEDDTWLDVSGGRNVARLDVTGLTNGTTYYFQVRAVSAAGASEPSNTDTAEPTGS